MRIGSGAAAWMVAVLLVGAPVTLHAQDPAPGPRVEARVRQVAGNTIYVDLGTNHGLAVGDTLDVSRRDADAVVGRLTVTVASPVRSVLSFAGPAFSVTRGEVLAFGLLRAPSVEPPPVDEPVEATDPAAQRSRPAPLQPGAQAMEGGRDDPSPSRAASAAPVRAPVVPAVRASGRWSLEMAVNRASSEVGTEVDPVQISRTYATPALRLDLRAPRALGGFDLRLSTRTTYRYGTDPGFDPTWSPRVYEASLERRFEGAPVHLVLGRFHSPGESFSGYWDGASLRLGGDGFGVGAIAGFQPDRWNQLPTADLPKASVFVDFDRRGQGLRWLGDASVHVAWPSDGAPTHTSFGFGQRVSTDRLRVRQEVQVDRDPFQGGLHLSLLTARAAFAASPALDLHAGVSRRETYLVWALDGDDLFSSRRDRADVGVSIRGGGRTLSTDVGLNRDVAGHVTRSITSSFSAPRVAGTVGFLASASWWDGDTGHALSVAPSLSWRWGSARLRAGYRFYSSDVLGRARTTHSPDVSIDVPFSGGVRATLRMRGRWGDAVRSEFVQFNLSRVF